MLLALAERGSRSCADAREIAAAHLMNVRTKLIDLSRLEKVLGDTVKQCEAKCCHIPVPACPVFEVLQT